MPKFMRHAPLPNEPIEGLFKDGEFVCAEIMTKEEKVMEFILRLDDPFTVAGLGLQVDASSRTIYNVIKGLVDEGLVVKIKGGMYECIKLDNG
jgi:predicted transcriptional regulator